MKRGDTKWNLRSYRENKSIRSWVEVVKHNVFFIIWYHITIYNKNYSVCVCVCSNVLKQKQKAMDQKDAQIKETLKRDVKCFILNYFKKAYYKWDAATAMFIRK